MHQGNFDLTLDELSKIEGHATLTLKVREGKVVDLRFSIAEFKRFYTQAIRGKDLKAIPSMVSRICGTCSNAHLLCAIKALENSQKIEVTEQTKTLRRLIMNGLMIRDHALHLYVFALPDLFKKDSLLDFDENNAAEHELLHDTFSVKGAGNRLSTWAGGRSVHAPYPVIGGFSVLPKNEEIPGIISELEKTRPQVLKLIKIFAESSFEQVEEMNFVSLKDQNYNFLEGCIGSLKTPDVCEYDYGRHLDLKIIPYSQAAGYTFAGEVFMVGALARINLNKDKLPLSTIGDTQLILSRFPSKNIYDNNLAQALEILTCIDDSLEILRKFQVVAEPSISFSVKAGIGTGVIEAPRGTLYYKLEVGEDGKIKNGQIVVPTGQNQILIEKTLLHFIEKNITLEEKDLAFELEKIVRAFDPCMSCASHFLKIKRIK